MDFGVQTYTIRHQQKKDLEQAYLPLIRMGIRDLEIARIHFDAASGQAVRALQEQYGIRVAAIQVKPKQVFGDVQSVVDFCKATDCRNVVLSQLPFDCVLGSEQRFYDFVSTLDRQARRYARYGITLAYHHHNWEYIRLSNGKSRMDVLLENTEKIQFVHDTYWTTRCGLSSPQQIRQFGHRLLGIHMRDLALYKKGLQVCARDAAVGQGVIDFAAVLEAAAQTPCQYFAIEQNTATPYEDLQRSYEACLQIRNRMEEKYHEAET